MKLIAAMTGLAKLVRNLDKIDSRVRSSGLRTVVRLGSKPIQHALKQLASVETGALKRGQQTKVKTYRKGTVATAITGARDIKYKNGRNPSKYSHLVANGFRTRNGGFFKGTDYVRKAAGISIPVARSIAKTAMAAEVATAARSVTF